MRPQWIKIGAAFGLALAIMGAAAAQGAPPPAASPGIYVINFMGDKILVFSANATGNASPSRVIEGNDTGLNSPNCAAFDSKGNMYVLNSFGNSVTVYAPGASGDARPIRTISGDNTGLDVGTTCLAVDGAGNIYVSESYSSYTETTSSGVSATTPGHSKILVFAADANGDVKSIRKIAGSATRIDSAKGLAVDTAGNLYVANTGAQANGKDHGMRVLIYPPGANGNVAPIRTLEGPDTGLDTSSFLGFDGVGNLYIANLGQSTGLVTVTVYRPGATGDARPIRTFRGPQINGVGNIGNALAVDAAGNVYMTDFSGSAISVYAPGAVGNSSPIRTISGSATQLNQPKFIAVWPRGPAGNEAALSAQAAAPAASAATLAAGPPPPPPTSISGNVATYGDKDLVGFGYPQGVDPTAGAQLTGLAPGAVSVATQIFNHSFPFKAGDNDPAGSHEYPNTDQIFVGSNQTAQHDGYSGYDGRKKGPAVFRLDYSRLVPAGQTVSSLTLGIAADDFQFPTFNQPFSATVNGQPDKAITNQLNKRDETGPQTYFFTVGIDPSVLTPDHILTLAIDEGGDGGDGFAVDFLTVGVLTPASSVAAAAPAESPSMTPAPAPAGVAIPAGTGITVRMIDSIDSRRDKPGKDFSASVDSDVVVNGSVVIPKSSPAVVRLVNASQAGHFFGKSSLELRLVSVTVNGTSIAVESGDYGVHGASRTKQTVERVGAGTAIGGALGGLFGGGKGAAIGAGLGAGAGAGVQAVTRGKSIRVPSETKLDFTLSSAVAVSGSPTASTSTSPPATPTGRLPATQNSAPNLVINGDFEAGNTGFTSGYTYGNVADPGTYTVGPKPSQAPGAFDDWDNTGDHTTGKGNMFIANGANSASTVVWQEVVPVTPNTTYTFSFWGAQVDYASGSFARLQLKINGSPVGTGVIPANSPGNGGAWQNYTFNWNSSSSVSATLSLYDLDTDTGGNDFSLDDISFSAQSSP